jgi:hypothetical protein
MIETCNILDIYLKHFYSKINFKNLVISNLQLKITQINVMIFNYLFLLKIHF